MAWVIIANLKGVPGDAAALEILKLTPRRRGSADGLNLNDLVVGEDHYGWWNLTADGGSLNLPPAFVKTGAYSPAGRLDVLGDGVVVTQRVSARWPDTAWERTCLNTANKTWTPWRPVKGSTSKLAELARRDGWLAVYDPTDESSMVVDLNGKVVAMLDLLGNLPPMICDSPSLSSYPDYLKDEFGMMSAIGQGTMVATFSTPITQPLTVMAVASDEKYLGLQRAIFGGDSATNRLQAGLTSSEEPYIGTSALIRADEPMLPGPHIWEANYDEEQSTLLVDGQLVKRGLPTGSTQGLVNFRIGASRRSSGTLAYPWQGKIGAVLLRAGIDYAANNRMRQAMRALTALPEADPHFAPYVRAIDLDSRGRETVVWGDPDFVTTGSVASCTKVLNAVIVRKYVTDAMLDTPVTVLAEDEFIMNEPNLADGDVATYRELLHAMLIPSNNTAPRTLARTVGAMIPGGGDPTEKFIAAMQAQLDAWGFYGASIVSNPGGGLRVSTRHLALLMKNACQDALLKQIMGKATYTVTITGPNARTVAVTNTFVSSNDYGQMHEWVASKDGTGTTTVASTFVWRHPDGTEHYGALQGGRLGVDRRFEEIGKLIEAARSGKRVDSRHIPSGGFGFTGGPIPASWGLEA